jgi:tetratricopeptide (TPR) repeat protein
VSLPRKFIAEESLSSLEASLYAMRGDKKSALQVLNDSSDQDSFKRTLAVLIQFEDFVAAASEVNGKELHEQWVDRAAFVFAVTSRTDTAVSCVTWATANARDSVAYRTGIAAYDGAVLYISRDRANLLPVAPGNLSSDEADSMRAITQSLLPLTNKILTHTRVDSELEAQLLQRAIDCHYLLGNHAQARQLLDALVRRVPLPLRVGHAIIQGIYPANADTFDRLWQEHAESFDARLLACVILARQLDNPNEANIRARTLAPFAVTLQQKEDLCEFLYEMHLNLHSVKDFDDFQVIATQLVGHTSRIFNLIHADQLTRANKGSEALEILESIKDETDPRWLRGYGNAKASIGDNTEALTVFKRLGAAYPSDDVYRAIVRISSQQGLIEDERLALESALKLDPDNVSVIKRLAALLAETHQYSDAAMRFETLRAVQQDVTVTANLAVSYALAGQPEKALQVLVPTSEEQVLPLELSTLRAQILKSMGRLVEAFNEISNCRSQHWENPEFLIAYMSLGYAAGKELEASQALQKLVELQHAGRVDSRLMRAMTIEDIGDWIAKQEHKQFEIRRHILRGHMPWVTAAQLQNEVPLWSWLLKTQELPWIFDEPTNRAQFAIYSTNAFRTIRTDDGDTRLDEISCSDPGSSVVMDLSALITLHQLGLIRVAADYFDTIHIPATYLTTQPVDSAKLLPHQLSTKQIAVDVVSAHAAGRIIALASIAHAPSDLRMIDEYVDRNDPTPTAFSLSDLIEVLYTAGRLTDVQRSNAALAAHRASIFRPSDLQLRIGDKVLVSGVTLETVHRSGLFEPLVHSFTVHVSADDYAEFVARGNAFRMLEVARSNYLGLWDTLRSDHRFQFTAVSRRADVAEQPNRPSNDSALAAFELAKHLHLPLFSDDRCIQTIASNEQITHVDAAFGSDTFVIALSKARLLDNTLAAAHLQQLTKWRYRFIVLPAEILKTLADNYRTHPPGNALRDVAAYVHDCMRDPGLFTGLESTTVPTSMAVRTYLSWVYNVAEFIVDVWTDSTTTESYAETITDWAITELLPSPPKLMDDASQARLAALTPQALLSRVLIRSGTADSSERMNLAIRSITRNLGITEKQYIDMVIKVSDVATH